MYIFGEDKSDLACFLAQHVVRIGLELARKSLRAPISTNINKKRRFIFRVTRRAGVSGKREILRSCSKSRSVDDSSLAMR